jgi:hypothetical protein
LPVVHSFMLNFHYLPKEEALLFDTKWVQQTKAFSWMFYWFCVA